MFDVLVGVNLLREGLDLPEVALVAILDADKEGFLRNVRSLTQIAGRAARHSQGNVILYADTCTDSMRYAIEQSNRRREKQVSPKLLFYSCYTLPYHRLGGYLKASISDIRSCVIKC